MDKKTQSDDRAEETVVDEEANDEDVTMPFADEGADAGDSSPEDLEVQLEKALSERDDFKEALQRERADFVNFRKRTEREKSEVRNHVTIETIARFLPVLDDFERAISSTPVDVREDGWVQGFMLIHKKFRDLLLNQFGVEPVDPLGETFDPNWHEAIGSEDSDEYESGIVTAVLQKGYKLDDKCIRVAMVKVAN